MAIKERAYRYINCVVLSNAYCRIPNIRPRLIDLLDPILVGLHPGGLIFRGGLYLEGILSEYLRFQDFKIHYHINRLSIS